MVVSGYSYGKFDVCKFVNFAIGKFREGSLGGSALGVCWECQKVNAEISSGGTKTAGRATMV